MPKFEFVKFPTADNDAELNKARYKHIDSNICPPCFRQIIVGGTGSGKTSFLYSELTDPKIYKDVFDYILVFNGSPDANDGWLSLNSKKTFVQVVNEFEPAILSQWYNQIIEQQNKRREAGKRLFCYLIVFDDFVSDSRISNKSKPSIVDKLYMNGRHENISIVMLTQKYKLVNPNMRANNTHSIIVMPTVNKSEIEAIAKEHCGQYEEDDVIQFFNTCANASVPLTINKKKMPKEHFWFAFEKPFEIT